MLDSNARILALETSGQTGSVAIGTADGVIAAEQLPVDVRHASELMPAVQRLIAQPGWAPDSITDVFISIGPGSFTGLRIAVSVARTLAWSIGARIVAVPTMDALARNALLADPPPAHVAMIVDAKRAQVYTACYRIEPSAPVDASSSSASWRCVEVIGACLAEPREFLSRCPHPVSVLGEGIPRHRAAIEAAGAQILPESLWAGRAQAVLAAGLEKARAGAFTPARELVPMYIRRPEMEERWEARQAAARQANS
ncbi:MAG TPA: tRNA (adenosine(37)-N6)-threonylcarbamoyltransferase complex dimerization subunit type 1 TsaB [Phycisphaerae bacterium]|nr:tRNA (adenosine(37)-N6)-threonylcarbamoyltransferase complex dimerization subunit type 1 TsaB [Phycisphaerae bacterium]HOJ76199.1 tRNA (adenosine(37)-N6)-threonylcarbamoyltransferase complex dimerization subunit type 1 TsaB [Phycisphaerae bacterium]HOM53588.1 tRNA (adenosine(37)-N6)-threonylcarbamoyltransferase complex dimerization subunit type 1 TsaB [Phycisphaerae bacterium]HON68309.1 tRNA (adenosine(37)-N6)-threonylcarbamoyltransferase complex dimerization subunit type 1 TsaB [Phycisphaera